MSAPNGMPMPSPEYLAEDNRPKQRIGMIILPIITFIVLLMRMYARLIVVRNFGYDDAVILIAFVLAVVNTALDIVTLDHGAGLHLLAIQPAMGVLLYKYLVAAQLVYMVALWACRISGLLFYSRLGRNIHKFGFWFWVALVFVTATMIVQILLIALQCIPLARLWDPTIEGTCLGNYAVFIPTAALTIVCDGVILLLPFSIVWSLQATTRRKIGLGVVLCFGVLAVVISIFRMISMLPCVNPATSSDATWYFSNVLVWSVAEMCSAIVALSIPALKPLFKTLFDNMSTVKKSSAQRSGPSADVALHDVGSGSRGPDSKPKSKIITVQTDIHVSRANSSQENLFTRDPVANTWEPIEDKESGGT